MACVKCGYTSSRAKGGQPALSRKGKYHRSKPGRAEDPDLPRQKRDCPKCSNREAFYWLVQTRAQTSRPRSSSDAPTAGQPGERIVDQMLESSLAETTGKKGSNGKAPCSRRHERRPIISEPHRRHLKSDRRSRFQRKLGGIKLRSMDPSHIAMVDFEWPKTAFDITSAPVRQLRLSVSNFSSSSKELGAMSPWRLFTMTQTRSST